MNDDLSDINDQALFELDDSCDCFVGNDVDAYDLFLSKFPELIAEGADVDLVYVVPKSFGLEPDFYWALSVEERDKTHYRGFIPAFKKVNLNNFRMPSIKNIAPVFPFIPFSREGNLYVVTFTEDRAIISKVRLVFSECVIREHFAIPEGRRLIDCYPVKGYDVHNGKYISTFWCIQLDEGECIYMPVDLRLAERLKLPKDRTYPVYFYPISNGDHAIINDTLYQAKIDEKGMFYFEKQKIKVTRKLRAKEDVILEGDGDTPEDTQAHIIEFQPPNVHPKRQQKAHIIEFNR